MPTAAVQTPEISSFAWCNGHPHLQILVDVLLTALLPRMCVSRERCLAYNVIWKYAAGCALRILSSFFNFVLAGTMKGTALEG